MKLGGAKRPPFATSGHIQGSWDYVVLNTVPLFRHCRVLSFSCFWLSAQFSCIVSIQAMIQGKNKYYNHVFNAAWPRVYNWPVRLQGIGHIKTKFPERQLKINTIQVRPFVSKWPFVSGGSTDLTSKQKLCSITRPPSSATSWHVQGSWDYVGLNTIPPPSVLSFSCFWL